MTLVNIESAFRVPMLCPLLAPLYHHCNTIVAAVVANRLISLAWPERPR